MSAAPASRPAQVIHRRAVRAYLLLPEGPVPGTAFVAAEGDGDQVTCSVYLYLYGDDAAPHGARWEAWMAPRSRRRRPRSSDEGCGGAGEFRTAAPS